MPLNFETLEKSIKALEKSINVYYSYKEDENKDLIDTISAGITTGDFGSGFGMTGCTTTGALPLLFFLSAIIFAYSASTFLPRVL